MSGEVWTVVLVIFVYSVALGVTFYGTRGLPPGVQPAFVVTSITLGLGILTLYSTFRAKRMDYYIEGERSACLAVIQLILNDSQRPSDLRPVEPTLTAQTMTYATPEVLHVFNEWLDLRINRPRDTQAAATEYIARIRQAVRRNDEVLVNPKLLQRTLVLSQATKYRRS